MVILKSGRGCLLDVVIYQRFQLQGFNWKNFGVLDKWSLMRGGHTLKFDCMIFYTVNRFLILDTEEPLHFRLTAHPAVFHSMYL